MSAPNQPQIIVVADAGALAQTAARRLIARVNHGTRAAVCLTGGSSPLGLYRLLAQDPLRSEVPWERIHWFMGDDRFVPESDPLSNMGAAKRAFLDCVSVPQQNIHPMPTTASDPDAAARRYEDELKRFYDADRLDPRRPLFDLVLMGLGPDGHTASLFPKSPALDERQRWVVGVNKAGMEPFVPRVTLTFPALASTREMLFLVDSGDKRQILARVLGHENLGHENLGHQNLGGEDLPAHRAQAQGDLVWLVVRAAAPER